MISLSADLLIPVRRAAGGGNFKLKKIFACVKTDAARARANALGRKFILSANSPSDSGLRAAYF